MAFSSASSQLEVQSTIIVTFLLFVPLANKHCGLLVPLKALESKMKCDGNYFFPDELIFCFLLHIEISTDEPGPRHFQEGVLLELHKEASVSFFYLLSITPTRLRGTYRLSIIFFKILCSGCFYSHLASHNSLFL